MAAHSNLSDDAASVRPSRPTVDVCIVSYNSAAVLRDTMDAVANTIPSASISVREHGADADVVDSLRRLTETCRLPVRVEFDATNPGFGAGCNALARSSTAPWLLFLNPDAEVLAWPWTTETPPPADAIVGPFMVGDGQSERQSGTSYRILDEIKRSWLRRTGPPVDGGGFVSGAALLIDRASFERVGGFDERYFMFYEDIDLCLRANEHGIPTVLERTWQVRHEGAHSTTSRFGDALIWSYESACRFHGDRGESVRLYRCYVGVDAVLRSLIRQIRGDRNGSAAYRRLLRAITKGH